MFATVTVTGLGPGAPVVAATSSTITVDGEAPTAPTHVADGLLLAASNEVVWRSLKLVPCGGCSAVTMGSVVGDSELEAARLRPLRSLLLGVANTETRVLSELATWSLNNGTEVKVVGASWGVFADAGGVHHYEMCIGSAPGAADILSCSSVGIADVAARPERAHRGRCVIN